MSSENNKQRINKEQFLSKWLDVFKKKSSMQNINRKVVEDCYSSLVDVIKDILKNDQDISLVKFCKIFMTSRKAREAKNPKTGETMVIKAKKVPKVKFTPNFIDNVSES